MQNISKIFGKAALLASLVSLLAVTAAVAAAGDLDEFFGNGGTVATNVTPITSIKPDLRDKAYSVAIQDDGKILAVGESYDLTTKVGDVALVRYNEDGTLDTTFSQDGIVITNLGAVDQGRDIAIQPDGKIIVSGRRCTANYVSCDLAVLRYNANGARDTTFGSDKNGLVIIRYKSGNNGTFGGLELAADGKILIAGYAIETPGAPYDFAIYRLLPDGSLDTTFSSDGVMLINFGPSHSDVAQDLAIQPDGKIVVAGYTCDDKRNHCDFALARLWRANGALDKTFSTDGKQTTNFGGEEQAPAIALQADGKIVIAGRKAVGTAINMAIARYAKDGNLDPTFNGTGKKVIDFMNGFEEANYDVLVQPDGKIVTLGYVSNQDNNFAVVRLTPTGALDTSFGTKGKVQIDFGFDEYAYALALQADGKYVLVGRLDDGNTQYFALARLKP
jgi:uncharacterized delta-60 repeat protein